MKLSELIKCCLNYKVLLGVGVVLLVGYFVAPQLAAAYWPLLLVLIYPVSMILMMLTMQGKSSDHGHEAPQHQSDKGV